MGRSWTWCPPNYTREPDAPCRACPFEKARQAFPPVERERLLGRELDAHSVGSPLPEAPLPLTTTLRYTSAQLLAPLWHQVWVSSPLAIPERSRCSRTV